MADYNWASDDGSTLSYSASSLGYHPPIWHADNHGFPANSVSWSGSIGDAFDDDLATSYAAVATCYYHNKSYCLSETKSVFEEAEDINSIVAKFGYGFTARQQSLVHTYLIEAYYSSSWNTVASGTMTGGNGGTQTVTSSSLGLTDVGAVRMTLYAEADLNGTYPYTITTTHYELQAFGAYAGEIGLRVKGTSSIERIGGRVPEATDKVRISDGTTTYGLPLVATDSVHASTVRIYDGSATMALVDLDA